MTRLKSHGVGKEYEQTVREAFERDTARHEMTIVRDAGVDGMHLRFKRPDSYTCGFELTTWDDYLCFCGDMGTYVFQRTKPMFSFFRREGPGLTISPRYWSEKLQAVCKTAGYEEFSHELAEQVMREELENLEIALSTEEDDYGYCPAEAFKEIFQCNESDETNVRRELEEFEVAGKRIFSDVWEHDFRAYTLQYIWCCWAIVWGIRKYDEHMAANQKEEA